MDDDASASSSSSLPASVVRFVSAVLVGWMQGCLQCFAHCPLFLLRPSSSSSATKDKGAAVGVVVGGDGTGNDDSEGSSSDAGGGGGRDGDGDVGDDAATANKKARQSSV